MLTVLYIINFLLAALAFTLTSMPRYGRYRLSSLNPIALVGLVILLNTLTFVAIPSGKVFISGTVELRYTQEEFERTFLVFTVLNAALIAGGRDGASFAKLPQGRQVVP